MSIATLIPQRELVVATVVDDLSLVQLLDLLLKDRRALQQRLRLPDQQRRIVPRLLTLGLIGFAIYGVGATVMLNAVRVTCGF
jgi:hypothetical protein